MEQGATVHIERERQSDAEDVVLNPADDSASSYETSSTSENERQEVATVGKSSPNINRWRLHRKSTEKTISTTPAAALKDLSKPSIHGGTHTNTLYSDEWIKEDAARWAATFTAPADSGNVSQEERATSSRPCPSRNRSRKRKAEKLATRVYKAKSPEGLYNDSYRQLVNEEIRDTLLPTWESHDKLPQSQIGVTVWTSAEKDSFFTALVRFGKDNVYGIASKIGSKSELEVQEYIHLLHQGMLEKYLTEPRQQLLGFTDMPAAIQISQECCNEIEKTADALASRQNRYEEQQEQQKWGGSWLLNSGVNLSLEEHLAKENGSYDTRELLPAAELLKLHNWLELSTRVFMNPAAPREEENWQFLAEPGEEPSIRATAFADFHRLATSVTKRLVATTIFCTMSRLRAMDPRSFNRYEIIKPADVEAAAKIIGLKINSTKFWRDCPRRCNLNVMKSISTAAANQEPMDYDEVEIILSKRRKSNHLAVHSGGDASRPAISLPASPSTDVKSPESLDSVSPPASSHVPETVDVDMDNPVRDLASEYLRGLELEYNVPIDPSGSEFEHPHSYKKRAKKNIIAREALDRAHVKYTEAFDIQASLIEEQRLWGILGREPPFAIKPEELDLPKRPTQGRKEEDEIKDWRDHIQFWSQWETLDQPVPTHAFSHPLARPFRQQASTENAEVDGSSPEAASEEIDEILRDADIVNDGNSDEDEPDLSDSDP